MSRCLLNFYDFRQRARTRLPRGLFDFVDGGAEDQRGLEYLRRSFDEVNIIPSVLVDVSNRSLVTRVMGEQYNSPLIVAPTGLAGLLHYDGDISLARACAALGIPFCVSMDSTTSFERIAQAVDAPIWLQLYLHRDRSIADRLVQIAKATNVSTLVLTVDMPVPPNREYNVRNGLIPLRPSMATYRDMARRPGWLFKVLGRYLMTRGMPAFEHFTDEYTLKINHQERKPGAIVADDATWQDVERLRRIWPRKLVLKGVLSVPDALRACQHGIDGIVVSSHGVRNLDTCIAPIQVLSEIADAVGERLDVLADSGVRRGSDVVKLLAAGATAVMVGRAPLYGIAAGGQSGAEEILRILNEETLQTMAAIGSSRVSEIGLHNIRRIGERG
ncbi:alpha-hydroxy acid oxidase [Phyllobacterium sp. SB3]|uniref:alpha-hydroxy acid oxidase n=1 Tax=Phyllobacterium sp. SB3 TaxID=3156073 RepID=UPI0032AEE901